MDKFSIMLQLVTAHVSSGQKLEDLNKELVESWAEFILEADA